MTDLAAEVSKLNKSQRNAMRRIVPSTLSKLCVEQIGWKTRVRCDSVGFRYTVELGPRGAVLSKYIREAAEAMCKANGWEIR